MVTKIKPYRIRDVNEPEEGNSLQYNDPNTFARGEGGGGGGGSSSWGQITGTLSNQTDLQGALDDKQDKLTAGTDLEIVTPQSTTTVTGNDTLSLENAVKNSLNSITAYGGDIEEVEQIPGYTLLEYIDGGGADPLTITYIDTGITPVANTLRVKYKGQLLGNEYGGSFMGAVAGTTPRGGFRFFSNANNGQLCIQTYNYTYSMDMGYDVFDVDITINNQTKKLTGYVNSTTLNETNSGIDLNFNKNMLIHGIYLGDNVSPGKPNRCYWCLIEKNGEAVRDFVPVIRNSDNEIGYYDKVSQTFFANQGPGTFTAGPVKGPRNLKCNNGTLKVRQSIADFSSGLIRRSSNTQISLSSSKCGIEYTFKTSAGYIGKVFPITVGNKYTINYASKSSSTGSSTSIFYIELNNVITKIDDNYGTALVCPYTFTATKPYVGIWLGYPNVVSGNVTINVSGLTLIEGEIPANTIYTDGTTETIEDELGNTATAEMLLKVGDKADTQEILTGAVTRNVRVVTFDGSETFASSKTGNTFRYTFDITDYPQYVDGVSSRGSVVSSHFTSAHSSSAQTPGGAFTYNGGANNKKLYFIPSDQNITTVALFKEWVESQYINGTPLIAMYPLDTAGTETVTGQTLNVIRGDNDIDITQASITPLSLTAIYEKNVNPTINFTNDTGYITSSSIPTNVSSFTNDSGYITSSAIPTNVSSFTNDSGYLTSSDLTGYQTTSNMVTSLSNPDNNHYPTTKAVADAIQGAGGGDMMASTYDPNNVNANAFDYTNFINTPTIPTKTSDITNDSGFITSSALPTKVSDLTNDSGFITGINSTDVTTALGYTPANNANLGTASTKNTGTSSGNVPVLDSNGKLANSTLPGVALTDTFTVSTSSDLITLSNAEQGDIAIVTSENKTYVLSQAPYSTASNWKQILSPTGGVTSVNGQTGAVTLSIPTKTSDITNDSGFITSSYHDSTKQDTLVSGTNIKTINNESLLGNGNITVEGGNTKTFYLSSTSDLTNAQSAYDWYLAGKNPIIIYGDEVYNLSTAYSGNIVFLSRRTQRTLSNKETQSYYRNIQFILNSGTVTSISINSTNYDEVLFLSTNTNYSTPYTPLYDGSPATKKYVDDKVSGAVSKGATAPSNPVEGQLWYDTTNDVLKSYNGTTWVEVGGGITNDTTGTTSTISQEWVGTKAEFEALSSYGDKIYNIIE